MQLPQPWAGPAGNEPGGTWPPHRSFRAQGVGDSVMAASPGPRRLQNLSTYPMDTVPVLFHFAVVDGIQVF
jgi:hypothetical protein